MVARHYGQWLVDHFQHHFCMYSTAGTCPVQWMHFAVEKVFLLGIQPYRRPQSLQLFMHVDISEDNATTMYYFPFHGIPQSIPHFILVTIS